MADGLGGISKGPLRYNSAKEQIALPARVQRTGRGLPGLPGPAMVCPQRLPLVTAIVDKCPEGPQGDWLGINFKGPDVGL